MVARAYYYQRVAAPARGNKRKRERTELARGLINEQIKFVNPSGTLDAHRIICPTNATAYRSPLPFIMNTNHRKLSVPHVSNYPQLIDSH